MESTSTAAHYGQRILGLCAGEYVRAGEPVLPLVLRHSLLTPAAFSPEVLMAGLEWLLGQGYVEEHGPLYTDYRLTPSGFTASQLTGALSSVLPSGAG